MAQKTRGQLQTQSDNTFLDNSTGQIVPVNHREWNNDTIDSAAMVADGNTFTENNEFQNITFVKNLKLHFSPFTWDASNNSSINFFIGNNSGDIEGNCFTIINDGFIYGVNGLAGTIYYAIHTGNVKWDNASNWMNPPISIQMFPNDVLIFILDTNATIRVLGVYRAFDINNQINGQNYFTINNPQAALDLATNMALSVGATYKVVGAFELPKNSDKYWDIFLRAETNNKYENTCYLANQTNYNGILQKAFFAGDFNDGSILITDTLDTSNPFTWTEVNENSGNPFANGGSKVFVSESLDLQFNGHIYFATANLKPQNQNVLNIQDAEAKFGLIKDTLGGSTKWISNSALGTAGTFEFGTRWYNNGLPTITQIDSEYNSHFGSGATLSSYRLLYSVVNNVCKLDFWAELTADFNKGASSREMFAMLPTPFLISANSEIGYGSIRNINTANFGDIPLQALYTNLNLNYFLINSKHSNSASAQSLRITGSITFIIA